MKKAITYNASLSRLVILFFVVAICSSTVVLNGKLHFSPGSPATQSSVNHFSQIAEPNKQKALQVYGKLPLSFEANQGQSDSPAKFLSRGDGYSLFLTSTEAVRHLTDIQLRIETNWFLLFSKPAAEIYSNHKGTKSTKSREFFVLFVPRVYFECYVLIASASSSIGRPGSGSGESPIRHQEIPRT